MVWKGEGQQNRQMLEVPAVPIYIQDDIRPQVVIENLRLSQLQLLHTLRTVHD